MKPSERQSLKAKAHPLKPVVLIGSKGLTDAVVEETNHALLAHELIKVKIAALEKMDRDKIAHSLSEQVHADLIQQIGKIAILYRPNPES